MNIFQRFAVFAMAAVSVIGSGASASVFDDVVVYLQADSDLDGDGKITNGEAKDASRRNSPDGVNMYVCGSVDGTDAGKGIACPVTDVALPRRGITIRDRVFRMDPKVTNLTDGKPSVWGCGFQHTSFELTTNITVFYRFRWSGEFVKNPLTGENLNKTAVLMNNGDLWHNGIKVEGSGDGFRLHIQPTQEKNTDPGDGDLFFCGGNSLWIQIHGGRNPAGIYVIKPNKWYDLAMTFDCGQVCLYLYPEGEKEYKKILPDRRTGNFFRETRRGAYLSVGMYRPTSNYNMFYPAENWTWHGLDNADQCFIGDIHTFAYWNRILSADEIEEVFMGGVSADAQIGSENGGNYEFCNTGSGTYRIGEGWHRMKGELSGPGDSLNVIMTNEAGRAYSRVFHVKTCPGSAGALSLSVNGKKAGMTRSIPASGNVSFVVPGEELEEDAENTLTLTLERGGPVAIDWAEIGGGFKIEKGSNTKGYQNYIHMMDRDTFNYCGNLCSWPGSSMTNRYYHFTLSEEIAGKFDQTWTVERGQHCGPIAAGYDVWANGTLVYRSDERMPLKFSFRIPREALKAGRNEVMFRNLTEQYADNAKEGYYFLNVLTVEPYDKTATMILVR